MNGKTARLYAVLASSILITALPAKSMPRSGESSGAHYLVSAESLPSWHTGFYYRDHDREMKDGGRRYDIGTSHAIAYVGYDALDWLTVYGLLGHVSFSEKDRIPRRRKDAVEFGVGAWFNLLDHDTLDYLTTVQRFIVQGAVQYSMFHNSDITWGELSGNVTFGLTHEIIGNKFFWPDAVSIYAGPTVNIVVCDDYDQPSDGRLGLLIGADFLINRRVALGASIELFDKDEAYSGYITARF